MYRKTIVRTSLTNFLIFFFCQKSSFHGKIRRSYQSGSHTLPMKQGEILEFFYRMTYGVSQVEKCTLSLLLWITLHNTSFDLTAFAYHSGNPFHVQLFNLFLLTAYKTEKFFITDQSCFQDLTHSTRKLFCRQRRKSTHIHINKTWLMKSSNHIFILLEIYSCFSTNAAVYLSK